jgi:hypothetical protein
MCLVIKYAQRLLDRGMSRVVPVAHRGARRQRGKQLRKILVQRQLIECLAILETKRDSLFHRVTKDLADAIKHVRPVAGTPRTQPHQRPLAHDRPGRIVHKARAWMVPQVAPDIAQRAKPEKVHMPEMADQDPGADLRSEVDRAFCLPHPLEPLTMPDGGGFKQVGRCMDHAWW